eukprot:6202998-Pleurochrysis_carterae.AAC.1
MHVHKSTQPWATLPEARLREQSCAMDADACALARMRSRAHPSARLHACVCTPVRALQVRACVQAR